MKTAAFLMLSILPASRACLATHPITMPDIDYEEEEPNCCACCTVPGDFYRDDVICPNFGEVQGVSCDIVPKPDAFTYKTGDNTGCLEAFLRCPPGYTVYVDAEGIAPRKIPVDDFNFRIRCNIHNVGRWFYTGQTDMVVLVNSVTCYSERDCTGCTALRAGDPTNTLDCPPGYRCQPFVTAPGVGMEAGCVTYTAACGTGVDYIYKLVDGTFDVITQADIDEGAAGHGAVCLNGQWVFINTALGIYYKEVDSVTCGFRLIGK